MKNIKFHNITKKHEIVLNHFVVDIEAIASKYGFSYYMYIQKTYEHPCLAFAKLK